MVKLNSFCIPAKFSCIPISALTSAAVGSIKVVLSMEDIEELGATTSVSSWTMFMHSSHLAVFVI